MNIKMIFTSKKHIAEKKLVFFRNDDVGIYSQEPLDRELINLTNLFVDMGIPICHAVVPDAVTKETVTWIRDIKNFYPSLISIGQHGFKHVKNHKGEFGGRRSYKKQKADINNGFEQMRQYFGPDFSYWFAAPWVVYNRHTKKICDALGFKIFSGGVSPRLYAQIFNAVGRILNVNTMGRKDVSYHRKNSFYQKGFNIHEVSVSVDVISDFTARLVKPLDSIFERFQSSKKYFNVIGILLHHWVFNTQEKLNIIKSLLTELQKDPNISFSLIENIEDEIQKK